jgi:hypothetical protein
MRWIIFALAILLFAGHPGAYAQAPTRTPLEESRERQSTFAHDHAKVVRRSREAAKGPYQAIA